jgi:serine/threonine-protein kinase
VALAYRSPEQVRGDPISRRADIWSLGVILYEMIAGRRPFCGSTTGALAEEILGSAQAPLSAAHGTPAELDRVLAQALAKDARRRYPAVGELVRELQAVAPRIADSAAPARVKRKPSKRKALAKASRKTQAKAPGKAPAKASRKTPAKAPRKTPRQAPPAQASGETPPDAGARDVAEDGGRADGEAEGSGGTASAEDALRTEGSAGDVESAGAAAPSSGDAARGAEAVASSASASRAGILFAGLGALLLAALLWILSRGF